MELVAVLVPEPCCSTVGHLPLIADSMMTEAAGADEL